MTASLHLNRTVWATGRYSDTNQFMLTADRSSVFAFVLGTIALALAGHDAAEYVGWWLFVGSLFVLGMPHGGLDLLLARRLAQRPSRPWRHLVVFYLAVLSAAGVALWALPIWTLVGFGVLTALHFGLADQRDALEYDRGPPLAGHRSPNTIAGGLGRGLVMLGLALAFDPAGVLATFGDAQTMLGVAAQVPAGATVKSVGLAAVSVGLVLIAAALFATPTARCRARLAKRHFVEVCVLALAAWSLPAITYIGLYFVSWHSLRHFARVLRLESTGDDVGPIRPTHGRWLGAAFRLHLWSMPLSLPVVAALLLIGGAGLQLESSHEWATLVLLSFVVLTPAHHLLIEWVYAGPAAGDRGAERYQEMAG